MPNLNKPWTYRFPCLIYWNITGSLLAANIRLESRTRSYAELLRGKFDSAEKYKRDKNAFRLLAKALTPRNLSPIGGKASTKALEAHAKGGKEHVDKLIDRARADTSLRADVYTTIARQCQKQNPEESAKLVARALECDPHLYRLKWYAFRLHGAGKVLEAEAILDLLGENTSFSEQEKLRSE